MKRKRMFLELSIVWAIFCLTMPLNADTPWLHTDGNRIKDPAGNVVVLRGIDLVDLGATEMWYGGAINMIDRLTNKSDTQGSSPGWYPKAIRIAIFPTDSGFSSPFPFTPGSDNFYNNLLRPVVDYCRTKDMYAIIDWHYIDNTYSHVSTTSQFWTYMAPRFANDSHVLFELYNEPINTSFGSDAANWQSVRTDMQTWINIVRTYAPNNLILVAGPSWSQVIGPAATYPLTGNNIVIVSHIYPGHWLSGSQSWYTGHIDTCLTRYPVFMTEWGFTTTSDSLLNGTITNYGAPLSTFREARKISNSAWVASYDWQPPMFNTSWNLLVGEGQMGGFTKDTLYTYRNNDQPGGGGNLPPVVSITSPANGAIFTAPANITIDATASDTDGTITQVRFYQGTTLLGSDASAPYSFTWSNVGAGSYSLTADAIDNGGATTTSSPVNITVNGGGSGNIEVRARGSIGDETIDIRVNGITVATHTLSTNLASYFGDGSGTVQVHFTNDNGSRDVQIDYVVIDSTTYQSEDMPINTGVWTTTCGGSYSEWLHCNGYIEYGAPANNPPTVSITSPANGATFTALANITIDATASDTDGTITQVEFYQGTTLLGTDTTSPYSYTWNSVAAGSYSLTAKATDDDGAVTTSSPVSITVNPAPNNPPTVSITSPANGATFTAPANITINATASDSDGTITQVEFYQGTTLLGTDTTSPYSYTWNSVAAGSYSLTAKATDDDGAVTTSTAVNITVNAGGVVTLLNDGFETNFNFWTDGGTTDWDRATSQKYAGSYSAHAGSTDNDLISDNLNTSGKTSITIDFWFRDDDIDDNDDIYLQLYNGSSYVNFYELGNSTEDTWNHYTVTITSSQYSQYFRTNFRIKFEGTSIDYGENLWIDAVKVTAQ